MAYMESFGELLSLLEKNKVIIYGAGYVAQKFYFALKVRNLEKQVQCFIVSQESGNKKDIEGIAVRLVSAMEIKADTVVCLAVHEANRNEIGRQLQEIGITEYIWIYPYLWEMALGEPVRRNVNISIEKIIKHQSRENYILAVRYLAIENYFRKNYFGYDVYLKAMELHCERKTAEKRLDSFQRLIADWEQNGQRQDNPILIDQEFKICDGHHRFTLAKYFKNKKICSNVFQASPYYTEIAAPETKIHKDMIRENVFLSAYIEQIERAQEIIFE